MLESVDVGRQSLETYRGNGVTRNPYVRLALVLCVALLVGSAYLPMDRLQPKRSPRRPAR